MIRTKNSDLCDLFVKVYVTNVHAFLIAGNVWEDRNAAGMQI